MEFVHFCHLVSMALLLGGLVSSFFMVQKAKDKSLAIAFSYESVHKVYSLGLVLLVITGLVKSQLFHWQHFKGAGYMHAKMALLVMVFVTIFMDIKLQKRIATGKVHDHALCAAVKKRQFLCGLSMIFVLIINWLVSLRPF